MDKVLRIFMDFYENGDNQLLTVQIRDKDNFLNHVWSSYISCTAQLVSLEADWGALGLSFNNI